MYFNQGYHLGLKLKQASIASARRQVLQSELQLTSVGKERLPRPDKECDDRY